MISLKDRARKAIVGLYRFLPVQLLLLHFRKYQLLLVFWLIAILTITGNFASHFGAMALFLAPEYLGRINVVSMLLLGGATAMFVMSWHITTFIIHSSRMPFIGAARQSFLKYCINNSVLPLGFLVFYTVVSVHFQWEEEHTRAGRILLLQLGFYLGFLLVILASFAYFFRVGRDLLKTVLSTISNPSHIREIIPYDTLDFDYDMIRADTYLTETLQVERIDHLDKYHHRLLNNVLQRHHRNAISATVFALVLLFVSGLFMERPALRIPAGAGFLILFSVMMGVVGAVKYFLKSWEMIGWVLFALLLSWMVQRQLFDLRSIGYGLNYHVAAAARPAYNYRALRQLFNAQRYDSDKRSGINILNNWKARQAGDAAGKPPLVVICVSGGGLRSAYWTFNALQYADSCTGGRLRGHTVLITGASGGMIGATYWRSVQDEFLQGKVSNPYNAKYAAYISRDLLNPIIFSLASVDLISPFNKVTIAGHSYSKDRGYAMEQELIVNTEGLLGSRIGDCKTREAAGIIPSIIINSTIVNDGRKLLISAQPVSYLTQPAYALTDTADAPVDAVDFGAFFAGENAMKLRTASALRMNATFPYILPVVKLPSVPVMDIMDAGLRDNFGIETATRYLDVFHDWMDSNTSGVILLQIRDTQESEVFPAKDEGSLGAMLTQPLFAITTQWEPFQSYEHSYVKDYAPYFLGGKMKIMTLHYVPKESRKTAALNFHLTEDEKQDIRASVYREDNQHVVKELTGLLGK